MGRRDSELEPRMLHRPRDPVLLALVSIVYVGREMGDRDSRYIAGQSGCIGCTRAASGRTVAVVKGRDSTKQRPGRPHVRTLVRLYRHGAQLLLGFPQYTIASIALPAPVLSLAADT